MKGLILLAVAFLSVSAASAQDLKPQITPEVTITNTFKAPSAVTSVSAKTAPVVDLDDISNVVAVKEAKRKAREESNRQLDLEYKAIPNKPSKIRHPFKRVDLWADYHQDAMRKYRTRVLPIGEGVATVLGMGFSCAAALR